MPEKYTQSVTSGSTRFSASPMAELEFSTLTDNPILLTTLSAGDIVPIYCAEVLPHDTFKIDLDFITRQTTLTVPVMGQLVQDFYAFFVPNRVVNKSWKNVMGENTSGSWTAPEVSLAPLVGVGSTTKSFQIPVGSVADYYGYPTQAPIPREVLQQCHDLKFRGYLEIYNNYFRDQNYQPPIPYSKLNVFNGFFNSFGSIISIAGDQGELNIIPDHTVSDGSLGPGAVVKEVFGEGGEVDYRGGNTLRINGRRTVFSGLGVPLKANKLHDYFTSVLPTPQKGRQVAVPIVGDIPLKTVRFSELPGSDWEVNLGARFRGYTNTGIASVNKPLSVRVSPGAQEGNLFSLPDETNIPSPHEAISRLNLVADLSQSGVSVSVSDLRLSSAIQRVYEILGNGGSRYTEFVNSFFGIEVDNPFDDIPLFLGHFRRDLDLYQTAQTSATPEGNGTPQGNLSAFGYTNKNGSLFTKTFNEHGYIHIFTVIRHKNIYPAFLGRDNFRMSMLDFYSYPLANISEQPVYTRQINPFLEDTDNVFGYQEAWAEYRYEPDRVTGYMRPGIRHSLAVWNYADDFNSNLVYANGEWLKSNTASVVARSTALLDSDFAQFKLQCNFKIVKERPIPVYSVPGADIF